MKKFLAGLATAALAVGLSLAGVVAPAAFATNEGVCPPLDTGHLSASSQTTYTYTAPAGQYIVGYCVKAGSVKQGNGPEQVAVAPTTSITFSHSSLKEISHFSVDLVTDQCPNIEGYQDAIPPGYISDGQGNCIEDEPEPLVASASVSTIPPTCEVGELLVLGATSNASFGVPTLTVGPGNYEVVATADAGAEFPGGFPTQTFNGVLAGPLTGPSCDDPDPLVASASVSTTPPTCEAGETLVLGATSNASFGVPTLTEGPGNYEVVATADAGAEFPGGFPTQTFNGVLAGPLTGPACDPPTLGLVMPAVSTTPLTCTASGSYTLGAAPGYDPALLTWTVDGVPGVPSGTYAVTSAKTVTVVANPVPPNGLEPGWVDPAPLVFSAPSAALCGDLPTLAFTGSDGGTGQGGLLLAGGLLVLGALAVYRHQRSVLNAG